MSDDTSKSQEPYYTFRLGYYWSEFLKSRDTYNEGGFLISNDRTIERRIAPFIQFTSHTKKEYRVSVGVELSLF